MDMFINLMEKIRTYAYHSLQDLANKDQNSLSQNIGAIIGTCESVLIVLKDSTNRKEL